MLGPRSAVTALGDCFDGIGETDFSFALAAPLMDAEGDGVSLELAGLSAGEAADPGDGLPTFAEDTAFLEGEDLDTPLL